MTIRHLKIFTEVAKCGKMSQAAANLYISQPTVSQTILELESHYQVKLFERFSKSLHITEEGKLLLTHAKRILAAYQDMEDAMLHTCNALPIRVGATVTVGTCIISDLLTHFEAEFPQVQTEVYVNNTKSIEQLLLNNELDIGLVEGSVKSPDLCCTPVIEDSLVLVCSCDHPFAKRTDISLEDLSGQDFILREEGSGTRELFIHSMAEKGYRIHCKWTCTNADTIKKAVMDSRGLSVISVRLVEDEIRDGKIHIVPIKDCVWNRKFNLVLHKNKYISQSLAHFMHVAKHYSNNHALDLIPD